MKKNADKKVHPRKIKFHGHSFEIAMRVDADESVVAEIFDWQEYRAAEKIITDCNLPILDVGAHIGIFSLYAKAFNPSVEIYALEPEEENYDLLKKNVGANGLQNVKISKVALAGRSGERELVLEPDSINHHLPLGEENITGEKDHMKVRAYSLGDYLRKNNLSQIGLLKMDIEGGEYEVFENMSEEDFGKIKNIILEYHNYAGRNYKELESLFRKNGFGVQIFPSSFGKDFGFILARNKRSVG